MPYVQRDFQGKVTGLYRQLQRGYGEEWLPDDHPDVKEYLVQHPPPPISITAGTREDLQRAQRQFEATEKEIAELSNAILAHMRAWNSLETALSCLLYAVLHIQPSSSQIAYAIYYSLNGFDARQRLLGNVLDQFVDENQDCSPLREHWTHIFNILLKCAKTRNKVAHGAPIVFASGMRQDVRLAPPPFDVNKVGRLIKKGSDPGLTAKQISEAIVMINRVIEYIDIVNSVVTEYHQHGPATLPKTLPALEACLQNIRPATTQDQSHKSDGQNPTTPSPPPEPSQG